MQEEKKSDIHTTCERRERRDFERREKRTRRPTHMNAIEIKTLRRVDDEEARDEVSGADGKAGGRERILGAANLCVQQVCNSIVER